MYSEGLERLLDNTEPCMRDFVEAFVTKPEPHWYELFQCERCGTVEEWAVRGPVPAWCESCRPFRNEGPSRKYRTV